MGKNRSVWNKIPVRSKKGYTYLLHFLLFRLHLLHAISPKINKFDLIYLYTCLDSDSGFQSVPVATKRCVLCCLHLSTSPSSGWTIAILVLSDTSSDEDFSSELKETRRVPFEVLCTFTSKLVLCKLFSGQNQLC